MTYKTGLGLALLKKQSKHGAAEGLDMPAICHLAVFPDQLYSGLLREKIQRATKGDVDRDRGKRSQEQRIATRDNPQSSGWQTDGGRLQSPYVPDGTERADWTIQLLSSD